MKITHWYMPLALGMAFCAYAQQSEFEPQPGATKPKLIAKVEPQYSEQARAAGIRGKVVIRLEVGIDGFAHNLQVVRTLGSLDQRAIEAVRRWRFQPGMVDARPVVMSASVEVDFDPGQSFGPESAFHRFARQAFEHEIEAINFNLELRERDLKELDRLKNSPESPGVRRALEDEVAQLSNSIKTASEKTNILEYRIAHADDCAKVYMNTFREGGSQPNGIGPYTNVPICGSVPTAAMKFPALRSRIETAGDFKMPPRGMGAGERRSA